MQGIVLFYKPKGITSYDVIRKVKKLTGEEHIGHGGVLDPLAEGLLILGIGREATKKLGDILKNTEKEYEAVVRFGAISKTYDAEGPIYPVRNKPRRDVGAAAVPEAGRISNGVKNFIGEIWQMPPPYSAIKIGGEPAYARTRRGEKIKLKPKRVFIKSIEILSYESPDLKIRVITGSGVYIRSLAHDLGQTLGWGAYLADLRRTRVGNYTIEQAITFEDMDKNFIELRAEIFGDVHGVGFRFFALREGEKSGLAGWARNTERGTVEVLAQGKEKSLQQFLEKLERGPLLAKVEKVDFIFQKPNIQLSEFIMYNQNI
jgi:tRNA pseudouridine55 synthase